MKKIVGEDNLFDESPDDSDILTSSTVVDLASLGGPSAEPEDSEQISEADLQALLAQGSDTANTVEGGATVEGVMVSGAVGASDEDDDNEGGDVEISEESVLQIHSAKCLRCTALVGQLAEKLFKSCHYSSGNEACPAAGARIIIAVPVEKIVNSIMEAEATCDSGRLATIYSKLSSKDPAVQELVNAALRAARQEAALA